MRSRHTGHKPTPDIAGQQVLGAQQRDAGVNADHIGIEPIERGIIAVDKTIAAEHAIAEMFANGLERRNRDVGREHQRSPRRGWSDRSIHGIERFDLAIDAIALGPVRRRDAPDVRSEVLGRPRLRLYC